MNKYFLLVALTSTLLTHPCSAANTGPSFDCATAKTDVEKIICADPGLAVADLELAMIYKSVMDQASKDRKESIRQEQRNWLKERDHCPPEEERHPCLRNAYATRRSELKGIAIASKAPSETVPLEEQQEPVIVDLGNQVIEIQPFYIWRRVYRLEGHSKDILYRIDNHGKLVKVENMDDPAYSRKLFEHRHIILNGYHSYGLIPENNRFSARLPLTQDAWVASDAVKRGQDGLVDCFLDLTDRQSKITTTHDMGPCGDAGPYGLHLLGWHKSKNLLYSDNCWSMSSGAGRSIYQFNAEGNKWTPITSNHANGLFLSPDGKWIVWEEGGGGAVDVVPLGSGQHQKMVYSKQIVAYDIERNKNYRITNDISFNSFDDWEQP